MSYYFFDRRTKNKQRDEHPHSDAGAGRQAGAALIDHFTALIESEHNLSVL